ncbi:hypothetical protein ES705_33575 [subsurface metagenome]
METQEIKKLNDLIDLKDQEIRRLHKVARDKIEWHYFVLHTYRGLATEVLGPYKSSTQRNIKIVKYQSLYDEHTHDFIPVSIQGIVEKLQIDTEFSTHPDNFAKDYKPAYNEEGYTILPCTKCGKDFKKDAIDFLTGLGDEGNTICPECSIEKNEFTSTEMPEDHGLSK